MRNPRHRPGSPRRRVWVLWLALLLPVAQFASVVHALSHTVEQKIGDKGPPHSFACELCLTAAALHGGALRSEPPCLPCFTARHEAPQGASGGTWQALLAPAYRSRAPPHASL